MSQITKDEVRQKVLGLLKVKPMTPTELAIDLINVSFLELSQLLVTP